VDANPACPPLSTTAPKAMLHALPGGWEARVQGPRNTQVVRTGEGERDVTLDYDVRLADGRSFAFHGALDALPEELGAEPGA
jgi:hypothetical protein